MSTGVPSGQAWRVLRQMESGVSCATGWSQSGQTILPARAKSTRRSSLISVTVPTVERPLVTALRCWMAIAGLMPSIQSTSGLGRRSRNCRA